jgi:hypothetical protein
MLSHASKDFVAELREQAIMEVLEQKFLLGLRLEQAAS